MAQVMEYWSDGVMIKPFNTCASHKTDVLSEKPAFSWDVPILHHSNTPI